MTAQCFIDTNVLLYAGSGANEDRAKKAIARQVVAQVDIGFSAQVMQEFYHAAVRKERLKITHDEATADSGSAKPLSRFTRSTERWF